jgi:16S rRNA (adenine1518-N6/adenine1519-N6)-dimethyltransferase
MRKGARLGQHFLTSKGAAAKLAQAAGVGPGVTVVEVGPGKGFLTRELLELGGRVIAIEKDEELAATLRETFAENAASGQLTVITGDIRDFVPERDVAKNGRPSIFCNIPFGAGEYVVAANIPYYITGEIIRSFLETPMQPRTMALLIQKEVAERIVAKEGKESLLSLSVKAYGTPRIVTKVVKGSFNPPPSVDSAVISIDDISRTFFDGLDEQHFFNVLHAGFASKRKKLAGNLAKVFGPQAREALAAAGLDENVRAEDVPIEKWHDIALNLHKTA